MAKLTAEFTILKKWSGSGVGSLRIVNSGMGVAHKWALTIKPKNYTPGPDFTCLSSSIGPGTIVLTGANSSDLPPGGIIESTFMFNTSAEIDQLEHDGAPIFSGFGLSYGISGQRTLPGPEIMIGYYPVYAAHGRQFLPPMIPAEKLTHVVIGFMALNPSPDDYEKLITSWDFPIPAANYVAPPECPEGTLIPCDKWAQLQMPMPGGLSGVQASIIALRARNPGLRILPAIGGWATSWNISKICKDGRLRENFVKSSVEFIVTGGLDGIVIHWEWPGSPGIGYNHYDMIGDGIYLGEYVRELREALNTVKPARDYQIIIASGVAPPVIEQYADLADLADYIVILNYHIMGGWGHGGHQGPLYKNGNWDNNTPEGHWGDAAVTAARKHWPAKKIVLGMSLEAKGWAALTAYEGLPTIFGQASGGPAKSLDDAPWARKGTARWATVARMLGAGKIEQFYDDIAEAAWGIDGAGQIWSFECPESAEARARYIRKHGLAGAMFWDISADVDSEHPDSIIGAVFRALGTPAPALALAPAPAPKKSTPGPISITIHNEGPSPLVIPPGASITVVLGPNSLKITGQDN